MSLVTQVAAATGASTADVLRVARHGGNAGDWHIADAIEAAGGRRAVDTMTLGARNVARNAAWGTPDPADEAGAPHPAETTDKPAEAEQVDTEADDEVEEFIAAVYSDLDDLLHPWGRSTDRLVRAWTSLAQAHRSVRALLLGHPRTRHRARTRAMGLAA